MTKQKFKEGQWIIRRWSKANGGEIDFTKFVRQLNESKFLHSKFYRFKGKKLNEYFPIKLKKNEMEMDYFDSRMSWQWRIATKAEINKYARLIFDASKL